jgi:DNA-binding transcriptional MerR regulator
VIDLAPTRDVLLTTSQAALAADVPASTIRTWAQRGLITPAKRTRTGRPLYREADILDTETRTRRAPQGRPRA